MNRRYSELRSQLAQRLKAVLGNPQVEEKELMAFDILVNRRDVLRGAGSLTALTALVHTGLVPTAWARVDPEMKVSPKEVGLTAADQASVTAASQLSYGTELFKDSIYSQPVVSGEDAFGHGVIEGMRTRPKLQSALNDAEPTENTFHDQGFHYGPNELIQLEQQGDEWRLVHYYHPQDVRRVDCKSDDCKSDGCKTDGFAEHVIIGYGQQGVGVPTKILCVTGARTNKFVKQGNQLINQASYLVYMEQDGDADDFIVLGVDKLDLSPPYLNHQSDYTISWIYRKINDLDPPSDGDDYMFVDKYSHSGFQPSGEYSPESAYEHILMYRQKSVTIFSLSNPNAGSINLMAAKVSYPDETYDDDGNPLARIAHIEWDDTGSDPAPSKVVFCTSTEETLTSQDSTYESYCAYLLTGSPTTGTSTVIIQSKMSYTPQTIEGTFVAPCTASASKTADTAFDYSLLKTVQGLFSYVSGAKTYHVKLANFQGTGEDSGKGLSVFILLETSQSEGSATFQPVAHYRLTLPGSVGRILDLSGGVSKFGGFRFFAIDEEGHVFLNRQQRYVDPDDDNPYAPPIYFQYDADGKPAKFSTEEISAVPGGTNNSQLSNLKDYLTTTFDPQIYNILLNTILGFSTDATNATQAVCLGSVYKAVYARNRMAADSVHVAVKPNGDGSEKIGAFNVVNTRLEKGWYQKQIATQAPYSGLGKQESGEFYQATVSPTNAYGQVVSLSDPQNQDLGIEVRADAPCTVTDEVSNYYYDIDRYTSFLADVDPLSGRARLVVKAEQLGQSLYVRLVRTSSLAASGDAALLANSDQSNDTEYDWITVNMAAQAQQRMSTTSSPSALGSVSAAQAAGSTPDSTPYVTGSSLLGTRSSFGWQTKGSYSPTTSNFDNIAAFCNQSGSNLLAVQNTASANASGSQQDPLYTMTPLASGSPDSSQLSLITGFNYDKGTVTGTLSATQKTPSIFGKISHKLHDALHYLKHVEDAAYKDLQNGITITISATGDITADVGKEIMKGATGVENALKEAITTVEEFASVVTNVLMTIIKNSFIYQFIEAILALISLFAHLKDIQTLSESFQSKFSTLIANPPTAAGYDITNDMAPCVGSSNTVASQMGNLDTSTVTNTILENPLLDVLNNPFTNKLVGAMLSVLAQADKTLSPFSFDMSAPDALQTILNDAEELAGESLVEKVGVDVIQSLVDQLYAGIEDPKQTYANLKTGLGDLMNEFESEAMGDFYTFFNKFANTNTSAGYDVSFFEDMLSQKYLSLKIPVLADLFKLFGIGDVSGNNVLSLKGKDVVFFPIALVIWTTHYMMYGKSIKHVDDIATSSESAQSLGTSTPQSTMDLNFFSAIVSMIFFEMSAFLWVFEKSAGDDKDLYPLDQMDAWINWIPGMLSLTTLMVDKDDADIGFVEAIDILYEFVQAVVYSANVYLSCRGDTSGPKPGSFTLAEKVKICYFMATVVDMVTDITNDTDKGKDLEAIVGGDALSNTGTYLDFVYWLWDSIAKDGPDASLEWFEALMLTVPMTGNVLEIVEVVKNEDS